MVEETSSGNPSEWAVRTFLFMDLVESVRLMEENEQGVVRRWQELVSVVERDVLPATQGRLIKSTGDGLTLEFPTVQPALRAALAIQHATGSVNRDLPPPQHILLRMGAHAGRRVASCHDIYGHNVNLAARLMTLAGPGEIVVSADVRDQLIPVLDADIEDLGLCYLKNVQDPVRAYRVGPPGPRPVLHAATPARCNLQPSIAVIPFIGRGVEAEHQVIGELLADEVISALSRSAEINVISRLSTMPFRNRDTSVKEIAGYLNANYVLSGSYRINGNQVRLIAEVASAKTGTIVWSDSLIGRLSGVISGGSALIGKLVLAVSQAVMTQEIERAQSQPLPKLESYTLLMGAIALMHRLSLDDFNRAGRMLDALIERTPRIAMPWAWKAKWHVLRVPQGWSEDRDREGRLALDCTRRALDADPGCSLALTIAGLVHANLLKRLDTGYEHYQQALAVNPNDSLAWLFKGTLHAFKGEGRRAVEDTRRALRLSPLDPHRYLYDSLAATAALSAGQYKRAIDLAHRSLRASRMHTSTYRALAIAQWQLGLHEDARRTVAELLRLEPSLTVKVYLDRHPSSAYETGRIWSSALRQAGIPD